MTMENVDTKSETKVKKDDDDVMMSFEAVKYETA